MVCWETSMKTKSAKAKGRKLQDWVKTNLIYYLNLSPKVIDIGSHIRCAIMGERGADVTLSSSIRHLFPFSIECKNQETFKGMYKILDQAAGHDKYPPIAFLKMNKKEPLILMEAKTFFEVYFDDEKV